MNKPNTNLTNTNDDFIAELNALAAAAAEERGNAGDNHSFLKFREGLWTVDSVEVPAGETFVVFVGQIRRGYTYWKFRKPIDKAMRPMREPWVDRGKLSEADTRAWATDSEGRKIDPWGRRVYEVPMVTQADRTAVIFPTDTEGGKNAIALLVEDRSKHCLAVGRDELPIIELASSSYHHGLHNRQVIVPVLKIIGWCGDPDLLALAAPPPSEPEPDLGGALKDEIPF